MNYRRIWNGYRCQRNRGKNHYQIVMESLAKIIEVPSVSSAAMRLALKAHGLDAHSKAVEKSRSQFCAHSDAIFTGSFFLDPTDEELWKVYRETFWDKIPSVLEDADRLCAHEFNLLGTTFSYPDRPIDWHTDPVSSYRWPKKLYSDIKGEARTPHATDVKLPWELSRMQHLPTLGKAYRLTGDERYATEITSQITHWLDDNPCPYGVNWSCAMEAAIRIMNITWGYLLINDAKAVSQDFGARLATSIFQHGQYIRFNLEYGLRPDGAIKNGNHYLSDVVGLLHLGLLCPQVPKADYWKSFAVTALIEEMERQVHPDGMNFESSVAYHRLVLELFTAGALLCKANGVALPDKFWRRLERMYEFVLYTTRPDGKSPLVGDADDGRVYILSHYSDWDRRDFRYLLSIGAVLFNRGDMKAHSAGFSEEAFWLLGPAGMAEFVALENSGADLESKEFRHSGVYVMRDKGNYLLASCGEVGTEGIGNHKHNDLLSFELCAGGKPFIVDSGVYIYSRDPVLRSLFRSTAYHNTVVIDGQEQNRFRPERIFEMNPDASVVIHEWLSTPDTDRLDVEHTGYARLDPPVSHRRIFEFKKKEQSWEIVDMLSGEGEHTADWYFHFDVGISLEFAGENRLRTRCWTTNIELSMAADIPLTFEIRDGWVSHQYGIKQPANLVHVHGKFNGYCRTTVILSIVTRHQCSAGLRD
jgi:hypothetical protein